MKNLAVDIGNTRIKAAIFYENDPKEFFVFEKNKTGELEKILKDQKILNSIVCSVGRGDEEIKKLLGETSNLTVLNYQTKLPFKNSYETPETLGMDRVAAIAGAKHFFGDAACLVIDCGTCITYDFITSENNYIGGAISPGLQMRLNAMNTFTEKLPLIEFTPTEKFTGGTTKDSMLAGAYFGMAGEINEMIERYFNQFGEIKVITCGGDSVIFDKHIKRDIFAAPYLVLYGLNNILSFNVR